MARLPRYTTFQPGELERDLKALALKTGAVADVPNAWDVKRHNPLHLRWHECAVTYSDGTEGTCRYTRQGPTWHIFRLRHDCGELPLAYHGDTFGRDAASIKAMCQEKAAVAFGYAIHQEQKEAKRIQPPWNGYGKRKADPKLFHLSHERAIALAGKYALCLKLCPSGKLIAVSGTFETLDEANTAWHERGDADLIVALAVRWARRWTIPRFNPLYAEQAKPD
ncbi:hypothetical protein [Armatimonas sp.]|uniref:hypothetical protein n=1 Tax=Armatimonas sp. TaxID=1872638 RepID=UPI00286C5A33|nr:hypothetical protein [Armatimonas sp.]